MHSYTTYSNWPGGLVTHEQATMSLPQPYTQWEEHTPYGDASDGSSVFGQLDIHEWQTLMLRTGGKRFSKRQNFFRITSWGTNYPGMDSSRNWIGEPVDPANIHVLGKPLVGVGFPYPQGMNYKSLPDNEEHDVTQAGLSPRYKFALAIEKHNLKMDHHCVLGGNTNRTDLGVGEEIRLSFSPNIYTNSVLYNTWNTTAGSLTVQFATNTDFTAPSNAMTLLVAATLGDEECERTFAVYAPTGVHHVTLSNLFQYPYNVAQAGMHVLVYLGPTNVSFYRVTCMEVGLPATNLWGSFTGVDPYSLRDATSDRPISVAEDNSWNHSWDQASSLPYYRPWAAGGFTWKNPGKWWIGSGPATNIYFSDQKFELSDDGTMILRKFGHYVIRHPNEPTGHYY